MSLAPNDPEVIIFERSPFRNLDAIVQQDGRTVYFYLAGGEGYPPKACWLGNLVKGPMEINMEDMQQGIPPALPRIHCDHPQGRPLPKETDLEVVWFEEGNGAAILESGSLLGVIPPWSGVDEFCGYARDCLVETKVAWPIPQTESLGRRIVSAQDFWQSFNLGKPFRELQARLQPSLESRYGTQQQYWAIDNQQFPPRGLAEMELNGKTTFTTVGMSLFPQPNIEMYVENPSLCRRIELAFQVDTNALDSTLVDQVTKFISNLAQMPWKNFTWFGHQHTCAVNIDSLTDFPFALLLADPREPLATWRNDPIQTLWLVPINSTEMDSIREKNIDFVKADSFSARLPY
jgi:hypothetical protein